MKIILDINDKSRIPFFLELIKSLTYVKVISEVEDKQKSLLINDLAEAFNDVKLHEQGKK